MPTKRTRPVRTELPGIWQDGPGRFLVRVQWREPTGRTKERKAVATSLAEAVAKREELKGAPPTVRRSRERLSDFVVRWCEANAGRLAPSTRDKYAVAFAHISEGLGACYVEALLPSEIRAWQAREKGKGWANQTLNSWLRALRTALEDAVSDGVLPKNPARDVRTLPEGRTRGKRGTALSVEQFRRALEAVDLLAGAGWSEREPSGETKLRTVSPDVARMIRVLAWTGMRRGELLALRFSDVQDGELHIERSVWKGSERTTKTDDPRRVTLVAPLALALEEQRQWLFRTQHPGLASGLVFPGREREERDGVESWHRSPSVMDKPLELVARAASVPPVSPQSFRRTLENLERVAGIDPLVRRAVQGWRTERAQGIYATVDRSERDAAAAAVVRLVAGASA